MLRRHIVWAVVLVGLLFLPTGAAASELLSKVVCTPDTQTRGGTVTASVTFTNNDPSNGYNISRYALMQHFGGLNFSGPKNTAFGPFSIAALTGFNFASSTPCTPGTFGCTTIPGTASTTINFTIPVSVLPKQLVNTGFGFWGTKGSSTKKIQSTTGCTTEAQ